jgi:two-component sensor histidine kinase
VTDAANDPSITMIDWPIGSALYVPLAGSGGPIGVMALYRRRAGEFSPELVQFAELFASRAAVAIEHANLLEQTRRDAQAKAILLRELNHRVKNNLASIAGLLLTSPPELPRDARRWLDRVIDRIDGMARVHELFIKGTTAVTLPELIRKSLEPVLEIRPPEVKVEFDLEGDQINLRSDRAVTLAMVLHELYFNALRHGVRESGTITIQSRVTEDRRISIQVIDDGGAIERDADAATTAVIARASTAASGIGLSLVRGLVGRELRGEFTLEPRPGGGTTATIWMSGAERNTV